MNKILEMIPELGKEATVSRFSELVGKSKSVISDHKNKGTLKEGDSLFQWLHSYMAYLSKVAGGRGSDSEDLTSARIEDLNARTAINRLNYHEKLESLIPLDIAQESLNDWSNFANQEISEGFNKLILDIESQYKIEVDEKLKEKNAGSTTKRIKDYAEKMVQGLSSDIEEF